MSGGDIPDLKPGGGLIAHGNRALRLPPFHIDTNLKTVDNVLLEVNI